MLNLTGILAQSFDHDMFLNQLLLAIADDGMVHCKLRLFSNDVVPDDSTGIGAFTEASFNGYVAIDVLPATWPADVSVMPDGSFLFINTVVRTFTGAGDGSPQPIYGWYLTLADGTDYIGACRLPAGVDFQAAGSFVSVEMALGMVPLAGTTSSDMTTNAPPL